MSDILPTLALATGVASVAAIAGYHLLLPTPGVGFVGVGSALADEPLPRRFANPIKAIVETLTRSHRRHQTVDMLLDLDDHLLRDVGLTRGIMVSIKSADGGARGLYSDMIRDRMRRF